MVILKLIVNKALTKSNDKDSCCWVFRVRKRCEKYIGRVLPVINIHLSLHLQSRKKFP